MAWLLHILCRNLRRETAESAFSASDLEQINVKAPPEHDWEEIFGHG